ncbi:MAG TPA: ABC transporter ATP-binding protein [Methylomirabilota bacterium]|nr:ABC transporter ATP-binding protein [Methylomirabilota bacterium]
MNQVQSIPPVAAVEMADATRSFGDFTALRDASLRVEQGTILGIIGPSGAGKTTCVRLMTGGLAPTAGTVRVLGDDPQHFTRRTRERLGYMPQQFNLYPDLSARENVSFMASLYGLLWLKRRSRVRKALEVVDLWDVRGRRAGQLSGGMQRRVELASALVHDPVILFLDEPTAGIDPLLRARIWEELHRRRDAGATLIVTTQYVNEAEECDQVALIAEGRLVAMAPPEELRRRAIGGQAIEVETEAPFDPSALADLPEVLGVRPIGVTTFLATVDDAGSAMPVVVESVAAHGGAVESAREYRPSFDDVFATLLEQAESSAPPITDAA